jgi:hypothetical protein
MTLSESYVRGEHDKPIRDLLDLVVAVGFTALTASLLSAK